MHTIAHVNAKSQSWFVTTSPTGPVYKARPVYTMECVPRNPHTQPLHINTLISEITTNS